MDQGPTGPETRDQVWTRDQGPSMDLVTGTSTVTVRSHLGLEAPSRAAQRGWGRYPQQMGQNVAGNDPPPIRPLCWEPLALSPLLCSIQQAGACGPHDRRGPARRGLALWRCRVPFGTRVERPCVLLVGRGRPVLGAAGCADATKLGSVDGVHQAACRPLHCPSPRVKLYKCRVQVTLCTSPTQSQRLAHQVNRWAH